MATPNQQIQPQAQSILPRLFGIDDVTEFTGFSKQTLHRMVKDGEFPPSRRMGKRRIVWLETDIRDWIENLPVSNPLDHPAPNRKNPDMPGDAPIADETETTGEPTPNG